MRNTDVAAAPGGHTRASRNGFVVCDLGRAWSTRPMAVEATSEFQSVVLIDGKGQGKRGGRCPAGRTVALADAPQAPFDLAAGADGRRRLSMQRRGKTVLEVK